jgi:hypothetical protein
MSSWPLGQSYWLSSDYCKALGTPGTASTYNVEMATAAANAWSIGGSITPITCSAGAAICKTLSGGQTATWGYTGTGAGHVYYDATGCGGPTKCCCHLATDPTWN